MSEIWKSIKNYSKYEISSLGRVKALPNVYTDSLGRTFHTKEKILSTKVGYRNGRIDYTKVKLVSDTKEVKNLFVHRLVAEAFIPNPNNYPEVNHIDLNKANNNVKNLEWVTRLENVQKCIQKPHKGETNGNHKLTNEMIQFCFEQKSKTYVEIARAVLENYQVSITLSKFQIL